MKKLNEIQLKKIRKFSFLWGTIFLILTWLMLFFPRKWLPDWDLGSILNSKGLIIIILAALGFICLLVSNLCSKAIVRLRKKEITEGLRKKVKLSTKLLIVFIALFVIGLAFLKLFGETRNGENTLGWYVYVGTTIACGVSFLLFLSSLFLEYYSKRKK